MAVDRAEQPAQRTALVLALATRDDFVQLAHGSPNVAYVVVRVAGIACKRLDHGNHRILAVGLFDLLKQGVEDQRGLPRDEIGRRPFVERGRESLEALGQVHGPRFYKAGRMNYRLRGGRRVRTWITDPSVTRLLTGKQAHGTTLDLPIAPLMNMIAAVQGDEGRFRSGPDGPSAVAMPAAPTASVGTAALGSYFAFAGVGSAFARTFVLASVLRGVRPRTAGTIWGASVVGGLVGILTLLVIGLLGIEELPVWVEVPPAVVAVQAGFNGVMGWLFSDAGAPLPEYPDLRVGDLAFVLYGAITLPGTALFIVVMTAATVLE